MPFPLVENYEKNIQASINLTSRFISLLEPLKSEEATVLKRELEAIIREMHSMAMFESFPPERHIIVFETFPLLIARFIAASKQYFSTIITAKEVELHRKLFSPILSTLEQIPYQFTVSEQLPRRIQEKLIINSFGTIKIELEAIFIRLARKFPTNDDDIFTGEESIPEDRKLTLSSGHQFDLVKLLTWQYTRPIRYKLGELPNKIKYLNPYTNQPLTESDLRQLRIKAILKMSLHTFEDNPQKLKEVCEQYLLKEEALKHCREKNYPKIKEILIDEVTNTVKNHALADAVLYHAVTNEEIALVEFLLKLGVSANPSRGKIIPLIEAARKGTIQIVTLLLMAGARINAYGFSQNTALKEATASDGDDIRLIQLLLEHHAEVDQELDGNETALYVAVREGKVNKAKLLLTAKAKVDVVSLDWGGVPLAHAAIKSKSFEMIKLMKEAGVSFAESVTNERGTTPLQLAQSLKLSPEITEFIAAEERASSMRESASKSSSSGLFSHSPSQPGANEPSTTESLRHSPGS